ncbi:early nodulin-like protein 13 [Malania oleifera]|uniref:early nodulin-like protein 13 n=1 Tax=Malania oleifera TaxID=397392 RepID=UPI0025ADB837|nr:early nodulin-like protein 13 [Malania oleifera]
MAFSAFSILSSSLVLLHLLSLSEARNFVVGGNPRAWTQISETQSQSLNKWAETNRFHIGDTLEWSKNDSVVQVSHKDYIGCNTSSPIADYKDGNTTVKLDHSGPYFFIGATQQLCKNGQKLIVVVMSERHGSYTGLSPAASPLAEPQAPAVAPTSGAASFRSGVVVALMGILAWGFL